MFGLKKLIEFLARVTYNNSTITNHILAGLPIEEGVIDVGLSANQLIYCTRKISRIKRGTYKRYIHIRCLSLENYSVDIYEETLMILHFRNYQNFENTNDACFNFISKFMEVIDQVAPIK